MIVGDSISQGLEGDYTWRYRLARHFTRHKVTADFVGPWHGTWTLPPAPPPVLREKAEAPSLSPSPSPSASPPSSLARRPISPMSSATPDSSSNRQPSSVPSPRASQPPSNAAPGAYRPGVVFDHPHYARWGRLLAEAKDNIHATTAAYAPDVLMVGLGFNDLAWGVSTPDQLLADLETFVHEARRAAPTACFLIADVVHRTPVDAAAHLPALIDAYNDLLPSVLRALDTLASPVIPVAVSAVYDPAYDTYDGLHPNSLGELKIARAFADAYSATFEPGSLAFLDPIPETDDPLPIAPPASLIVLPTQLKNGEPGVRVAWRRVFGASGYWLYLRDVARGEDFTRSPLPIAATSCELPLPVGHTYEVKITATRGDHETAPTRPVTFALGSPLTDTPTVTLPRTA